MKNSHWHTRTPDVALNSGASQPYTLTRAVKLTGSAQDDQYVSHQPAAFIVDSRYTRNRESASFGSTLEISVALLRYHICSGPAKRWRVDVFRMHSAR